MKYAQFLVVLVLSLVLCTICVSAQVIQPAEVISASPPTAPTAEEFFAKFGIHPPTRGDSAIHTLALGGIPKFQQWPVFVPITNGPVLQNGETLTLSVVPLTDLGDGVVMYGMYKPPEPGSGVFAPGQPITYFMAEAGVPAYTMGSYLQGGLRKGRVLVVYHLPVVQTIPWGEHQLVLAAGDVQKGILVQETIVRFCVRRCGGNGMGNFHIRQASVSRGSVIHLEGNFPHGVLFPIVLSVMDGAVTNVVYFAVTGGNTIELAIPSELLLWGEPVPVSVGAVFPDNSASSAHLLLQP